MTIDEVITLLKFNNKHIADLKNDDLQQLAEWLEELKSYREHIFSGEMTQKMLKEEYNKAIDTFVTKIKKYMETTEQATYIDEINNGNDNYSAMTIYDYVDELANELKSR